MATPELTLATVLGKFLSFHCPQAKFLLAQCLRSHQEAGVSPEEPGNGLRRTQLAEGAPGVGSGGQHRASTEESSGVLFVETLAGTQVATVLLAVGHGLDDVAKAVEEKRPDIPAMKQRFFIAKEQVASLEEGSSVAEEVTLSGRTGQVDADTDDADGLVAALHEHVRAGVTLFLVINTSQRAALEVLFHALDGNHWKQHTLWCSQRPISDWQGVTTNTAGQVVRIDLNDNGIGGKLPGSPAVWDSLNTVEELYLARNRISGKIPPAMAKLQQLGWLRLDHNQLSGCVPHEFVALTEVGCADFSNNPDMLWPIKIAGVWEWQKRGDEPAFFGAGRFEELVEDLAKAAAATTGASTALQRRQ